MPILPADPLPIAQGGTGQTTAETALTALLPVQAGQQNKILSTNGTTVAWVPVPGATPGGSNTQIQFNDAGVFAGSASFTIDKLSGNVTSLSTLRSSGVRISNANGVSSSINLQVDGNNRWLLQTDGTPETGGDSGTNFDFSAVADNGITETQIFTISRSSPVVDFKAVPTVNGMPLGVGSGSVNSVSATGTNGVTVSGSPITTVGTLTIGLGNITPTSVAATGPITGTNLSGTNTGDQTITLTGDITGSGTGTFATTLATVNTSPQVDAFRKITVNSKGLVTATSAVTSADIVTSLGYTPAIGMASVITSGTTQAATPGHMYVLTNVALTTVTLPASPSEGDEVWIMVANDLSTNIVERNTRTIMGLSENLTLNMGNYTYRLKFVNNSWRFL